MIVLGLSFLTEGPVPCQVVCFYFPGLPLQFLFSYPLDLFLFFFPPVLQIEFRSSLLLSCIPFFLFLFFYLRQGLIKLLMLVWDLQSSYLNPKLLGLQASAAGPARISLCLLSLEGILKLQYTREAHYHQVIILDFFFFNFEIGSC